MRRKLPPPIVRASAVRPLSAAVSASRLPTAAALAFALASVAGCAMRGEDVQADPVAVKSPVVVAPPSASAQPGTNVIDPEPHALSGEPAIVAPVASVSAKPKVVPVTVPTIKHRTAGVPMHVKPNPHDPDF